MAQAKAESGRGDLLRGALDMLVLRSLQLEPMHGWGISERIQQWSDRVLSIGQGSLYPSLYRLEHRGYITSEWGRTEHNRRARYYSLTTAGRRQLAAESASWQRFTTAVAQVFAATDVAPEETA